MTIQEAITKTAAIKPHKYDRETLVGWLSDLDGLIYNEIVKWHEGGGDIPHGPYNDPADADTTLLVPEPYADVYIKYLAVQIDFNNAETARYQNSMIMFNTALSAFADWYNRNNLPKQNNFIRI